MKRQTPSKLGSTFESLRKHLPKQRHTDAPLCNVIDGMGLVHAAYNAYSKLSFRGSSTAIIFGVPQMIKSVLQRYPCRRIIVCWDGEKHPKRLELLPEYKSHRLKKRDPVERAVMEEDIKKCRKLLYYMGIPQAYDPEVEGDDMVYFIWREVIKGYKVNIVTGDKDFIQLLDYDTQIYNPRTNSPLSVHGCPADFTVEVPQFIDYLCLVGDDSDDIPGYRGVGPKTAQKFFKQFYSIKEYLESDIVFAGLTDKDKLREIYYRNRRLIDLALFARKYYPKNYQPKFYNDKAHPNFRDEKYRQFCIKYRLKTMLYPAFIEIFKNR